MKFTYEPVNMTARLLLNVRVARKGPSEQLTAEVFSLTKKLSQHTSVLCLCFWDATFHKLYVCSIKLAHMPNVGG